MPVPLGCHLGLSTPQIYLGLLWTTHAAQNAFVENVGDDVVEHRVLMPHDKRPKQGKAAGISVAQHCDA
eukprot:SAG31_NODE_15521_length_750_cov_1.956989_2_plen_69_part_00